METGGGARHWYKRAVVGGVALAAGAAAVTAAVAGTGYPASRPHLLSGAAWLASSQVGEAALLDGASAELAGRVRVAPQHDRLDVVQDGSNAYAIDSTAGSLIRIDGATFKPTPPVAPIPSAGKGLIAFAGHNAVYALDTNRGVATETDPRTLTGTGVLLPLAARVGPRAAALDGAGRLWVLDDVTGDLVWLDHGRRHVRPKFATAGSGMLTIADGAPVVVDAQRRTATVVDQASGAARHTLRLDVRPDDQLAISGSPNASRLYVAASRGVLMVCELAADSCGTVVALGSSGTDLGAAVEAGSHVFVPDYTSGQVWIVDLGTGRVVARPQVLDPRIQFQLLSRDGVVFFNDPDSEHAGIIRLDGTFTRVPKYDPENPDKGADGPGGPSTGPSAPPGPPGAPKPTPPDPRGPDQPPVPAPNPPGQPDPPEDGSGITVTVSTTVAHTNEEVRFSAESTGRDPMLSIQWTFGDGHVGDKPKVSHSWAEAGTYNVVATATFPHNRTASKTTALVVTAQPILTVHSGPGGRVTGGQIDCPGVCQAPIDPQRPITLTADAAPGFAFTGWTNGPCGGTGDCTVTGDVDTDVTAGFRAAVSASVTAVNGSYKGSCPPPSNATTYQATITVPGPVTIEYRWLTAKGGGSDSSRHTLTFGGKGQQSQTVTHNETKFVAGQTVTDSVYLQITGPVPPVRSNQVGYRLTCVPDGPGVGQVSPSSWEFGTLRTGQVVHKRLTLRNVGGQPLTVAFSGFGEDPNDFTSDRACDGVVLQPGASCTVTVTITVAHHDARFEATGFVHFEGPDHAQIALVRVHGFFVP